MFEIKKNLRQIILNKLAALSESARQDCSHRAVERLLNCLEWQRATTVLAFDSFGMEVDTHNLLAECLRQGKMLALPRIWRSKDTQAVDAAKASEMLAAQRSGMYLSIHRVINLETDLERNKLGFREPKQHLIKAPLSQIDLIIAPGLAYDIKGQRLGRGKGCYDRLLAMRELQRAIRCALVFDCQIINATPTSTHDQAVDMIITESSILRVSR